MPFIGRGIKTVRTDGNQTIAGDKTFTGDIISDNIILSHDSYLTEISQQGDGNFVIYKNNVPILADIGNILYAPNNGGATADGTVTTNAGASKSNNGYIAFSNGLIINWGTVGTGSSSNAVSFAKAYTQKVTILTQINYNSTNNQCGVAGESKTGFTLYHNSGIGTFWAAIGY